MLVLMPLLLLLSPLTLALRLCCSACLAGHDEEHDEDDT